MNDSTRKRLEIMSKGSSSVQHSMAWPVGQERVCIAYSTIGEDWLKHLGDKTRFADDAPHVLCEITSEVRLIIETKSPKRSRISAVFSPQELVAILGDKWPNEKNLSFIRRSVTDRKAYPIPEDDTPSEKSFGAQGQTKKPGSHSESRHK